jgi:hypothetical protein
MASFRDRALLALSDPTRLGAALLPAGDTDAQSIRTMLASTYDLAAVRVDQVRTAAVRNVTVEQPLFAVSRRDGVLTQTVPAYTRTELTVNVPQPATPVWLDLLAQLDVTVVTEVTDPGGAEAVLAKGFDDFTTFDEFRARFTFFDLDAFLAKHHISTVEELRDAFDYVVAEIRLRRPAAFDPNDPANVHILAVTLAAVVVDPFDLAEGLRAARLVREAARDLIGPTPTTIPTESIAAYATAVVFAADAGDATFVAAVEQLYASQKVVGLFVNP